MARRKTTQVEEIARRPYMVELEYADSPADGVLAYLAEWPDAFAAGGNARGGCRQARARRSRARGLPARTWPRHSRADRSLQWKDPPPHAAQAAPGRRAPRDARGSEPQHLADQRDRSRARPSGRTATKALAPGSR